jgi:quercetin dioxygenase-like cupin family protein
VIDVTDFPIKRAYYIYDVDAGQMRAGHRHKINRQVLICLSGSCSVYVDNGLQYYVYKLDKPDKALILEPQDWHYMYDFDRTILLVLASELYDRDDYIDEGYPRR